MAENEPQNPSTGKRSRLEDEVLEILVRTDRPPSISEHVRRKAQRTPRPPAARANTSAPRLGSSVGPGTLLIGSVAAAFLASAVHGSSALLAQLLALLSVGLLVGVYAVQYGAPGRGNLKQWRGRDMDLGSPPPAWVESLRSRFRRPPRL